MKLELVDNKLYEIHEGSCKHCTFSTTDKSCTLERHCDMTEHYYHPHDTSQYLVKPIDWSECDPLVAYFLQRGLAPQSNGKQVVWVYPHGATRTLISGSTCRPEFSKIPKTTVKPLPDLIATLIRQGYEPDPNTGDWTGPGYRFGRKMFAYCGKEPPKVYVWHPDWLIK